MRHSYRFIAVVTAMIVLTIAITTQAQSTCPTIVETALENVGSNCDELGRNNVCYGYERLDTTLSDFADGIFLFNKVSVLNFRSPAIA